MREELQRTALLLDELSLQKIQSSKAAVFGIGGVGSYVVEALARAGIGSFILVDHDLVSISNINRQLIALHSTVGRPKVIVAKERILDVNPNASVEARQEFYLSGQDNSFLSGCSYIVDAIDTVASKLALVEAAEKTGLPILSSMGTGNKLDPSRFQIGHLRYQRLSPMPGHAPGAAETRDSKAEGAVFFRGANQAQGLTRASGRGQAAGTRKHFLCSLLRRPADRRGSHSGSDSKAGIKIE